MDGLLGAKGICRCILKTTDFYLWKLLDHKVSIGWGEKPKIAHCLKKREKKIKPRKPQTNQLVINTEENHRKGNQGLSFKQLKKNKSVLSWTYITWWFQKLGSTRERQLCHAHSYMARLCLSLRFISPHIFLSEGIVRHKVSAPFIKLQQRQFIETYIHKTLVN